MNAEIWKLDAEESAGVKKVVVVLIAPSRYNQDGYVARYRRAVMPCGALGILNVLTKQALERIISPDVAREIYVFQEEVFRHTQEMRRLLRKFPRQDCKLVVCLCGVQSAQFPRAADIVREWQAVGATCVVGGPHVSGSITTFLDGITDRHRPDVPCPNSMPVEVAQMQQEGVVIFHGEAEEVWQKTLADILKGRPEKLYRGGRPPIAETPLPEYPVSFLQSSFATGVIPFQLSRGCPFRCQFCATVNVGGNRMRARSAAEVRNYALRLCDQSGKASWFITDDNFARNPNWRNILDTIIDLRQNGRNVSFMVQADMQCGKIEGFLEKLDEAGCTQIFFGVETLNEENLRAVGKKHNKIDQYQALWQKCHQLGIGVHASYIVGLPHDTPSSIQRDVEQLYGMEPDQLSIYICTYLPGSEMHVRAFCDGAQLDPDLNNYNAAQPVLDHPLMSREELIRAGRQAQRWFHSVQNLTAILKRWPERKERWIRARNAVWYRWAIVTESEAQAMSSGFGPIECWQDRRPGSRKLTWPAWWWRRISRRFHFYALFLAEFFVWQHILFEVEFRPELVRLRGANVDRLNGFKDWIQLTFSKGMSRRWLNEFWRKYASNKWWLLNPLNVWHLKMLPIVLSECVYTVRFISFFRQWFRVTTA